MTDAVTQAPVAGDGPPARPRYTAVVYFHGIGSQRRLEETSRLVDGLDRYAFLNEKRTGRLIGAAGRSEASRVPDHPDVDFIALEHRCWDQAAKDFVHRPYRFYEAYWASVTAGSSTTREVVRWAFRQVANPIRVIFRPWRTQPRLRRIHLYRLFARWPEKDHPYKGALKPLLVAYDGFENPEQIRRYPKGSFAEFIDFLGTSRKGDATLLADLAGRWRRSFIRSVLWSQVVLLTLVLGIVLAVGVLVTAVLAALGFVAESGGMGASDLVEPTWFNAATLAVALLGVAGVTGLVTGYLGDVIAWATYQETESKHRVRSAILREGMDQLWQVLRDPRCERVVIVGHSLGTTVANDALLAIGRHALARSNEEKPEKVTAKLDQFVTLASPVDTIHSMFESHVAKYHRYSRVFEGLRGDVGGPPFSMRRKPHMHWINVWDRADIISGPLFSPNQKAASAMPVSNYEIRALRFPDPAASHVAYFSHHDAVELLFRVIFERAHSFQGGADMSAARITAPVPRRRLTAWHLAMLAVPWLALASAAGRLVNADPLFIAVTGWAAVGALAAIGAGVAYGRLRRPRRPVAATEVFGER